MFSAGLSMPLLIIDTVIVWEFLMLVVSSQNFAPGSGNGRQWQQQSRLFGNPVQNNRGNHQQDGQFLSQSHFPQTQESAVNTFGQNQMSRGGGGGRAANTNRNSHAAARSSRHKQNSNLNSNQNTLPGRSDNTIGASTTGADQARTSSSKQNANRNLNQNVLPEVSGNTIGASTTGANAAIVRTTNTELVKETTSLTEPGRSPSLSVDANPRFTAFQNQQPYTSDGGVQQFGIVRPGTGSASSNSGTVSGNALQQVLRARVRAVTTTISSDDLPDSMAQPTSSTDAPTMATSDLSVMSSNDLSTITDPATTNSSDLSGSSNVPVPAVGKVLLFFSATTVAPADSNTTGCLTWPRADFLRIVSTGVFDLKPGACLKITD